MSERSTPTRRPASGSTLLRMARTQPEEARARLRELSAARQAELCLELRPEVRSEFLLLLDQPEDVVPLLPDTEVCITVRAAGMTEASWLLELSSPEQRQACFDLDCWRELEFQPERALEWIDGLIEAGREVVAHALEEIDLEVWLLTLRALTGVAVMAKEDVPPAGGVTVDGVVYWMPGDERDAARVLQIAHAMYEHAPDHYWKVVYGLLFESPSECEEYALRWRTGRLADLGFPEREQAMNVYRPLRAEAAPLWESAAPSSALVEQPRLPRPIEGTLLAEALARLPAHRSADVLSYVLAVANSIAVADRMRLSDPGSVPRALEKAVRGIDIGLREVAGRRNQRVEEVLDATLPLDLFRVGATLEGSLRKS